MVHSGVVHNNVSSDMQITFLITDKMKPFGKLVVYYFDTDVWNADALIFDVHEDSDKFKNKVPTFCSCQFALHVYTNLISP
jgi:hypothetical protein